MYQFYFFRPGSILCPKKCVSNFKNIYEIPKEIFLFTEYMKKTEFSNLLFNLMGISQMICILFYIIK